MTNELSTEGNDASTCASACSDGHAEKKLTSRFRGVCWNKKNKRWQAAINHAGKYIYLGSFQAEEEAAKAFDRAAVKLRGQCAKINFAFSDYPAEMSWHKMLMQKANATDAVLKNPRCLRNKVELPMDGIRSFMGSLTPPPFLTQPSCNFNCNVYPFSQTVGHPEPLQGRVIGTQGQQPVHNGVVNPLYYYPRRGDTTVETMPMPCSVYMNGGEILSTSHPAAFTSPPAHLSTPAVRPQSVAQPVVTRDRTWPVVNMPAEARLTHWFSGPQNAFAMGFVRSEAAPTEVLLYDGRAMHEIGSFSNKDDAAQTSQSLLDILDNISTGNTTQPQYVSEMPAPKRPTVDQLLKVPDVEDVEDADPETAITGELTGKSPFDLPPGARPSFDLEETEKEQLRIPQKFDRPTIELAQSDLKGRTNSAPLDMKSGSLKQRMGSLLHLEPTLSAGRLSDFSPATPSTSPRGGGGKNGSNVRISSQSLRLSGSLQKMLSAFNQSGIIKKEDSEDDAVDTPFSAAALSFSCSPDSPPTSMPAQFLSPVGNSPQPYFAIQHSECVSLYMNNGSEHFTPFLKRKPDEMTLQNQACKKTKANPALNLS